MESFMTRIELHNASNEDYEILHAAMEKEGFKRTITSVEGTEYYLPTAEYYRISQLSIQEILESAKRAANRAGKKYAAVVTQSRGVVWTGLTKVQ